MPHTENPSHANPAVTCMDILRELQRRRESELRLIRLAERLGLSAPRACCPHPGDTACPSCSADWLAKFVRRTLPAVNQRRATVVQ